MWVNPDGLCEAAEALRSVGVLDGGVESVTVPWLSSGVANEALGAAITKAATLRSAVTMNVALLARSAVLGAFDSVLADTLAVPAEGD